MLQLHKTTPEVLSARMAIGNPAIGSPAYRLIELPCNAENQAEALGNTPAFRLILANAIACAT